MKLIAGNIEFVPAGFDKEVQFWTWLEWYSWWQQLHSGISNMTGYSHSCYSIKLIHWGEPERDVLSDKMVL